MNTIVLQESKDSSAIENIVTTQDELYKAACEERTASHGAKEVLNYREALYKQAIAFRAIFFFMFLHLYRNKRAGNWLIQLPAL